MRRLTDHFSGSSRHWVTRVALAACLAPAWAGAAYAQSTDPLTPLQIERTERLLENRIACRGCHVIAGEGGAIGPALDGISDRAELEYVRSVIVAPATIPGSIMPHQPMSDGDLDRLARYVHQQPAGSGMIGAAPQAPPALAPGEEDDGAALYARHCAACHGDTGQGDGWNASRLPVPPTRHADATAMSQRPDDTLYDGIAAGGYVLDRSTRMPAFGELLSDRQIRALVTHIRALCSCTQPAWAGGDR
jgi:mono/diheme cytochrome c family protein